MNFVFVESSRRAWGSEQHFVGLAKACHEAGHGVIAVVRAGSDVANLLTQAGVVVRGTPFRGGADPRAMLTAFKAVREIRADWLVTDHQKHYWPLFALARLTGTRLAVFRHMAYVRGWLTRAIFPRLVDRFFVVSDFALEALAQAGAPRNRLTRLYNQVDMQRFQPDAVRRLRTRAELQLPADALVVGFVGRHESGKGVRVLREALAQAMTFHPNLYAVWVGGGPEWQATQAAVQRSGYEYRHRFVEWTNAPEQIYVALDCLVAPSQAIETFGRVVAEAQACGVPVLASVVGGLREAFTAGQGGEVCSCADAALLAAQILRVCEHETQRVAMGRAGRRYVRRFDTRVITRAFLRHLTGFDTESVRAPVVTLNPALDAGRGLEMEPALSGELPHEYVSSTTISNRVGTTARL